VTSPLAPAASPVSGSPSTVVRAERLTVDFGQVTAVRDLDLTVAAATVTALVGGNGAGKSTTLRVLAGVVPPTSGAVLVTDVDVARDPLRAKHVTGYCPDVGGLVPGATPWEHLQLTAKLRGLEAWQERGRGLLARFDLEGVAHRVTAGFSHGMARRLSVVLAAFHRPPLVLLDEPFDGVDPLGVDATLETVRELRAAGSTVMISTHLLELAVTVADDAVVLRAGSVVGHCPAGQLSGADGVRRYRALLSG
jgi:ABC-2 type transport system ATP-binding protein